MEILGFHDTLEYSRERGILTGTCHLQRFCVYTESSIITILISAMVFRLHFKEPPRSLLGAPQLEYQQWKKDSLHITSNHIIKLDTHRGMLI